MSYIINDAQKVYKDKIPSFEGFYNLMEDWNNIYKNKPPWGRMKKTGLYASGLRETNKLCASKVLADEFSRLTFSEQVTISVSDDRCQQYIDKTLTENGFWKRMPEFLSSAYALGGGVLKVFAEKGKPKVDYITADLFVPTAWDNRQILEGVFESKIYKGGAYYTLLEFYTSGKVEYKAFKSTQQNDIGSPCPLSEIYSDLADSVTYPTDEPMFRYFKPDVSNNVDMTVPLGISVFSSAVDTLKAIDVIFDSFSREFVLGKKRIIVPSSCIQTVADMETGELRKYFDADDEAFVALKSDDAQNLNVIDNTPELRVEDHVSAINALLNVLCFQTGLSAGTLSFDTAQGLKTATEIISENSNTARTARGNKNLVAELIKGLVRSLLALGGALGDIPVSSNYEITVTLPDGVIIDDNTKIENNIKLVAAGLQSKLAAIMDIYNLEEAAAKKRLDEINAEQDVSGDTMDKIMFGAEEHDRV